MPALSAERDTPQRDGGTREIKVAASVTIYAGSIVMLDGAYAKPGAVAASKIPLGRAEETITNGATAGAVSVRVKRGVFRFANDTTANGDLRAQEIGSDCYIKDDQTVSRISTSRTAAGKVFDVDDDGVWVEIA